MRFRKVRFPAIRPGILALLGGMVYFWRAVQNVYGRTSFLDEGLYLYKGWLYAAGRAVPFADYAPWTNHMPLSFLVPGYVQRWFGPGLVTGRFFSVFLALLFLGGLYLTARRWGGGWLAAGAVWALALNLASIKVYSLALPEVLVAALLVWMLFLTLRRETPSRAGLLLAGLLGALILMTRINMAPALLFLAGYVWWQHGRRAALYAAGAAGLAALALHLMFWPGILKLWAAWLPRSLTPFLDAWRVGAAGRPLFAAEASPPVSEYWLYLWESVRLHFLSLGSAAAVWLLWPASWRDAARRRAAVALSLLLGGLYLLHLWVAFTAGFCVSCIVLYETYFDYLGLLLLAAAWPELRREAGLGRSALTLAALTLTFAGLTYAAAGDIIHSSWYRVVRPLLEPLRVWRLLVGRGGISAGRAVYYLNAALLWAAVVGAAAARVWRIRPGPAWRRFAPTLLLTAALTGALFTPTRVLGGGNDFFACAPANVPAAYRAAGEALAQAVPPDAQVFWVSRLPALLLYLPEVRLYAPQLNHWHSFWTGGDAARLYRFSRWNETLGREWMQQADLLLVEDAWLNGWVAQAIEAGGYEEVLVSPPPEPCRPESRLHVYRRP